MTTTNGLKLMNQVNNLHVAPGMLAMWALGQSGFILKGGETIVYIDPYLTGTVSDNARRFPPPLRPEEATNAQIVFCTHEHLDHTDVDTVGPLAAAAPQAIFVGPTNSRDIMLQAGIPAERILVPVIEQPYTIGDCRFIAIPAAHYTLDYDPERGYRWLGFIITLNGVTLYHSGDTILYEGLVEKLLHHQPDIACLPVNGRDWWREQKDLIGNLNMSEAVQLTTTIGADMLIPMHNNLFAGNRVNPAVLADCLDRNAPWQKYHWLQPGELYLYVR